MWRFPGALDFSSNVNPLGPSAAVLEAVRRASSEVACYPPPEAEPLCREASRALGVEPEMVVAGNGSSELIKVVCEAFAGARVGVREPTYSEYAYFSRAYGAEVVPLRGMRGLSLGFICRPNNPTGEVVPLEVVEGLAREAEREGGVLVVDEAYVEFAECESAVSLLEECPALVVLRSMTKFYSLPGLRVGFLVASVELAGRIARLLPPWRVSTPAIHAGVAALRDREFAERSRRYIRRERERLGEMLRDAGAEPLRSRANFLLVRLPRGVRSSEVRERLARMGILVRDCSDFRGLEGYIRVSVRLREENEMLVQALEGVIGGG